MKTVTSDSECDQHYCPSVRICEVVRPVTGSCGFHLTRSKWDPYPWVSGVESGSPAEAAGLQAGDCVLEVNGEDVLGQRIGEIASRVRARADRVTLLLWNAGSDPQCSPEVRYNNIKVYVHSYYTVRVTHPANLNDNTYGTLILYTYYDAIYYCVNRLHHTLSVFSIE